MDDGIEWEDRLRAQMRNALKLGGENSEPPYPVEEDTEPEARTEPRQEVQAGKLGIREFRGLVVISGLHYNILDEATAHLDTFGELRLHSFKKEQLLALAEVATYAANHALTLAERAG